MNLTFLSLGYMQNGLAAAVLVGVSCAVAGVFIVQRHIVFVSMVLSQLAVLGLAVAMYLGLSQRAEFLLAFAATLVGVLYLALFQSERRAPPDAILGMGFVGGHALSLLLLAKSSAGLEEARHLMSGNLLSVTPEEVRLLSWTTVLMLMVHLLGHRSFVFICADPEFAAVAGKRVRAWEVLFYVSLGLVISVALQTTGMFYVFACLVFPAMIGLQVVGSFAAIQFVSVGVAVVAAFGGVWLSFVGDFPTSEAIMSVQFALFALLLLVRSVWRGGMVRRFRTWWRAIRRGLSTRHPVASPRDSP